MAGHITNEAGTASKLLAPAPAIALCIAALKARMAIAPQADPQGRQSKEG